MRTRQRGRERQGNDLELPCGDRARVGVDVDLVAQGDVPDTRRRDETVPHGDRARRGEEGPGRDGVRQRASGTAEPRRRFRLARDLRQPPADHQRQRGAEREEIGGALERGDREEDGP